MINLSTIKGKLSAMMALSLVTYLVLIYLSYSNNKDAEATTTRMVLLADIRANTNGAIMELRGFQLHAGDSEYLSKYEDRNQKLTKALEDLLAITMSEKNQLTLKDLISQHQAWMDGNAPRITIIQKHGNKIFEEEFKNSAEGHELKELVKKAEELQKTYVDNSKKLNNTMKESNINRLNKNATVMDSVMILTAMVMVTMFYLLIRNITSSISRLEEMIRVVAQERDFTHTTKIEGQR